MRSRARKYSRQSPWAAHSLSAMAIWLVSAAANARALRICCLARVTSSAVTPVAPICSTASSIVSRTLSNTCGSRTVAWIVISPGSCCPRADTNTCAACFVSTSTLCKRPEGGVLRMLASTCNGASPRAARRGCGTPRRPRRRRRRAAASRAARRPAAAPRCRWCRAGAPAAG